MKIACLEEVALERGFVTLEDLERVVDGMPESGYREYLERVVTEQRPR